MLRTQFEEELLNLHNQFYENGMLVSEVRSINLFVLMWKHDKEIAQK